MAELRDALTSAADPPLLTWADGAVTAVAPADRALGPRLAALADRLPGLRAGASAPAAYAAMASAAGQARQALAAARRTGRAFLAFEDLAAQDLLAVVDGDALRGFADALLEPVRRHDRDGRGQLAGSLRAWLRHNGQLDLAAAELGVHRNTLRQRLRRAERLLGRDLADPGTRVQLWLALELHGQSPPGSVSWIGAGLT
jgi:purine catabolism regulator